MTKLPEPSWKCDVCERVFEKETSVIQTWIHEDGMPTYRHACHECFTDMLAAIIGILLAIVVMMAMKGA